MEATIAKHLTKVFDILASPKDYLVVKAEKSLFTDLLTVKVCNSADSCHRDGEIIHNIKYVRGNPCSDMPGETCIRTCFTQCFPWRKSISSDVIYLCKFNNRNTRIICEICSKLTTTNDVIDVVLVPLLLTLNRFHTLCWCWNFFKQVNVGWEYVSNCKQCETWHLNRKGTKYTGFFRTGTLLHIFYPHDQLR